MSDFRQPTRTAEQLNVTRQGKPSKAAPGLTSSFSISQTTEIYPLDGTELLFINVWNSKASLGLTIYYRWLDTSGLLHTATLSTAATLATDRSLATSFSNKLSQGYLISLAVVSTTGTNLGLRGQTYVQVGIIDDKSTIYVPKIFIADYVHSGYAPTWPSPFKTISSIEGPGRVYNVAPASPGAGAEFSITVPTNAKWRIIAMLVKFVTSSGAGTRTYNGLTITDGTVNVFLQRIPALTTAPSTTSLYAYYANWPTAEDISTAISFSGSPSSNGGRFFLPNPPLPAGYVIASSNTTNLLSGDQYSIPSLLVEEWIET